MRERIAVLVLAGVLAGVAAGSAQTAGPAQTFGPAPDHTYVTDGSVRAILRSGNTVYIGGDFTRVAPRTGAGAQFGDATGQARSGMAEVTGGLIDAAIGDGSGGWYIGGTFTHVGGLVRRGLAHIRPDGSVDPAFNPSPSETSPFFRSEVDTLDIYGSTLYVGGSFSSIGGQARNNIAALNTADGSVTAWNPDADGNVDALKVFNYGPTLTFVVAGGFFTNIGGQARNYLAELDPANGTATSWNPNPDSYVRALAVTGGLSVLYPLRIFAGGDFLNIGGQPRQYIAALDASGNAVSGWNGDADNTVSALAVSGSTLYAGGYFTTIGGAPHLGLAALNLATGSALSWSADTNSLGSVNSLAVSGSSLYVGGSFSTIAGQQRENLAAVDLGTAAVSAWNPSVFGPVYSLAVLGSSIYAGGDFSGVGGQVRNGLAAIDGLTGAPTSWNPDVNGRVSALAQSGSTLYIGGSFTTVGGQPRSNLAALDLSTGHVLSGWHADTDYMVTSLAVSGSTVYAGGYFSVIGGVARNHLAALDPATGATKPGWDPNANGFVHALALSGPTLYVGGDFHSTGGQPSIGGQVRNYIAALDAATGVVGSWNPNAGYTVYAIVPANGLVYVGGGFTTIGANGQIRKDIAALDAAGNATAWDPSADSSVTAIAVAPGVVYAGGSFGTIGGQPRRELAALDPVTGKATSWDPEPGPDSTPYVFGLSYSGGTLYVGGGFPSFDLGAQEGYASFSDPPSNTALPAVTGTPKPGQSLSCSKGSWAGSTPQRDSYAWLRDGTTISGATTASYVVRSSDVGHGVSCRVTAVNLGGSSSATSTSVKVTANSPPPCVVPRVVGKTLAKARASLRAHQCRVGRIGHAYSKKVRKGRVISQRPKPHKVLPNGGKVKLVLSRGRP